jgi:hypothetical protein
MAAAESSAKTQQRKDGDARCGLLARLEGSFAGIGIFKPIFEDPPPQFVAWQFARFL